MIKPLIAAAAVMTLAAAKPVADISMFPAPAKGMKQIVIRLPVRTDETRVRIEFAAGQQQMVDCNLVHMAGRMNEKNLQGWGYSYWELPPGAPVVSTRMGCPPKSERMAFVSAPPEFLPYRSALPIVVYVPTGFTVRYKLWTTDGREAEAR